MAKTKKTKSAQDRQKKRNARAKAKKEESVASAASTESPNEMVNSTVVTSVDPTMTPPSPSMIPPSQEELVDNAVKSGMGEDVAKAVTESATEAAARMIKAAEKKARLDELARETPVASYDDDRDYVAEDILGVNVIDWRHTRLPVVLPSDPEEKFQACFPVPSEEERAQHRLPVNADYKMFTVKWDDVLNAGNATTEAFVRANADLLGLRMSRPLRSLQLKSMSEGEKGKAIYYRTLANQLRLFGKWHRSPFKKLIFDSEARIGPFMGNPNVEKYVGADPAEYSGTWLVLKAAVAEWEKRRGRVADSVQQDIENEMPDFILDRSRRELNNTRIVVDAVQQMSLRLSIEEKYFKTLPVAMQFLEEALILSTSTEVRRVAIKEFCPKMGISPEFLRERVRDLLASMQFLDCNTYRTIYASIKDVLKALSEGTPDAYDPYMDKYEELRFRTYKDSEAAEKAFPLTRVKKETPEEATNGYDVLFQAVKETIGLEAEKIDNFRDPRPKKEGDEAWFRLLEEPDEEVLNPSDFDIRRLSLVEAMSQRRGRGDRYTAGGGIGR